MVCLAPKLDLAVVEAILATFFCSGSADTFFKHFLELKLLIESSKSLRDGVAACLAFPIGLAFGVEEDGSSGGNGGALIDGIGGGGGGGLGAALVWLGKIVWDELTFVGLFGFGFKIFSKKSTIY